MIKCIIFDMDGTLVDSERLNIRALKDLMPDINISIDALLTAYGGQKLSLTFAQVEERFNCRLPDDFEAQFRARIAQLIDQELTAFDHVYDVLSELKYPICIATNAPLKKAAHIMQKTQLEPFFKDRIFSAYEVHAWKPDPALFLYAARTMGFDPKHCLVVEDSSFGLTAGEKAGMNVLQFCGPFGAPQVKHYFRNYADFHQAVGNIERAVE